MIKNFEERKAEAAINLKEQYAVKPKKWWQASGKVYTLTFDWPDRQGNYPIPPQEMAIKYNLQGALLTGALFLLLFFWSVVDKSHVNDSGIGGRWLYGLILFVLGGYPVLRALNRKPRMVISADGIWLCQLDKIISWSQVLATYLEEDHSDDATSYRLLVHYYDVDSDDFTSADCKLDNLDQKPGAIAYYLEYYKLLCNTTMAAGSATQPKTFAHG